MALNSVRRISGQAGLGPGPPHEGQQGVQDCQRRRRATGDEHIHRNQVGDAAQGSETGSKDPTGNGADAHGQNRLGTRHGLISLEKRQAHMISHRSRHQEHIGFPGRGGQKETQAVHVVIRFVDLFDFAQTGAAGARVYYPEMERAPERSAELLLTFAGGAKRNRPFIISLGLPLQRRGELAEAAVTMDAPRSMK